MGDRELLEFAAKAAGIAGNYAGPEEYPDWLLKHQGAGIYYNAWSVWNPLEDSNDAFKLAIKLRMIIDPYAGAVAIPPSVVVAVINRGDLEHATRRAITQAAAEFEKEKNMNHKEWVDLTKEECFAICALHKDEPFSLLVAVQDKLKEKNGG